jgi:UDP-N-acetylmuramate--alanine ligase
MVAEADESDRSFLKLSPSLAVITNVDREHMETYGSFDNLLQAFQDFAEKVPFYGAAVLCADDPHLRAMADRIGRRVITYGITTDRADFVGTDVKLASGGSRCVVQHRPGRSGKGTLGEFTLQVPGRHNLLNALAAVAVGIELGLPFERIASALREFRGAERRFEFKGEKKGVTVVDDYGHHPTEIAAVLEAARTLGASRVVVAFQPHRYTRTQQLMQEFADVLGGADVVVLTDIYSAGEDPIEGVTVEALAQHTRSRAGGRVQVVHELEDVAVHVARLARSGDLVITLGAGSIGTVGPRILELLGEPCL